MILGTIADKKISDIKIQGLDEKHIDSSVRLAILTVLAGYLEQNKIVINGNKIIEKTYLDRFLSYVLNDKRAAPKTFKLNIEFDGFKLHHDLKIQNDYDLLLSFSGGIDSTAGLLLALDKKLKVQPVLICFGQKNEKKEIFSAKRILKKLGIKPLVVKINIDKYMDHDWKRWRLGIIPARNYLFAAIAGSILSQSESKTLNIWICAHKEEINPVNTDKSLRFFKSTTEILSNAYKKDVVVSTPFELITKPEIVSYWHKKWERKYGLYVTDTTSCYFGNNCGRCKACINRAIAFTCAGIRLENFQTNPFQDKSNLIQNGYIDRFNSLKEERKIDFLYTMSINRMKLPTKLDKFLDENYLRYKAKIDKRINRIRKISNI